MIGPMRCSTQVSDVLQRTFRLAVLWLCVSVVAACGGNSPRPGTSAESEAERPGSREGWFCQVGVNNDEWDCERGSTRREPGRLPEPRSSSTARTFEPAEPAASAAPAAPAAPPADAVETAPSQAASPPASSQAAPTALPQYVQLSYRPDKPVAILDLPKDFYAVQLVAVSSKDALEKYAREHKLSGMSAARIYTADKMFYVLLLGIYETLNNAEQAIASLSGPLAELSPWVRSVGSLQTAMLEADRVSGSENY